MTKHTYMLRTCSADMTSHNGFVWPSSGPVECPDWNPRPKCGGGLHGLLMGCGNAAHLSWDDDAKWLVVEVDAAEVVDIDGDKVKVPRGRVVFCGEKQGAGDYLAARGAAAVPGHVATAGHYGTATAGYNGTATAGYEGTAKAGDSGTATAGHYGTATAGYNGTATAGHYGTAAAGDHGTATAGKYGQLRIAYFDKRARVSVAYVGENGIKPGVAYRVDDRGTFIPADAGVSS